LKLSFPHDAAIKPVARAMDAQSDLFIILFIYICTPLFRSLD
jgi:hypothetical protein